MNVMKRFTAAVLLLTLVLCLCACGGSGEETPKATDAPVVETEAPVPQTEAPTEEPTEAEFNGYTVTVQDEDGNPVAGAMVQLCLESCFPSMTNESGVAMFDLEEADYKVSFITLPAGYTYTSEVQEFYFESGAKEMTIVLKAEA